jgi:hypothetical protein
VARCDVPRLECLHDHIRHHLREPKPADSGRSIRALCPSHDDHRHSLSVGIGDSGGIAWNCFAGCTQLQVRAGLIRDGVHPGCLPIPRGDRDDLIEQLWQILGSDTRDHAIVRLRIAAALDGYRKMPRGDGLAALAARAGVSRRTAFSARQASTDNPRT